MHKILLSGLIFGLISCSNNSSTPIFIRDELKSLGDSKPTYLLTAQSFGLSAVSADWPVETLGFVDAAMTQDGKFVTVGTVNTGDPTDSLHIRVNRYDKDGKADLNFGYNPTSGIGGGSTSIDISNPSTDKGKSSGIEWVSSLSLGPDDQIVLTGMKRRIVDIPGEPLRVANFQSFILRLTKDGQPDKTFNGGKQVDLTIDPSNYTNATHILDSAVDKRGKIVVVGYTYKFDTIIGLKHQAFVARFNQNGSTDTTFGGDGVISLNTDVTLTKYSSLYLQESGKIIIGGHIGYKGLVVRLEQDGSLDTSFGVSGMTEINSISNICDIQPQEDRTIIVGTSKRGIPSILMRLDNRGQIDTSFGDTSGSNGITNFDNGTAAYGKCALLVDKKDNSLFMATNNSEPRITKFTSNGRLDESFPGFGPKGYFLYGWPAVGVPGYPDPAILRGLFINQDGNFVIFGRVLVDFTHIFTKMIYGYMVVSEPKLKDGGI